MSVKKVILLSIFMFLLMACSKKKEVEKVIEPENKEVISERIIANEENIKINVFEYRGTPNFDYNDIWNLLLIKNKKKVDNVLDNPFHFGGTLEYLSYIKVDIDTTEGETWFSSWHINDSIAASINWIYLHIIKGNNIIKTYEIQDHPAWAVRYDEYKYIRFTILNNIPGLFAFESAWLYDVNKDGYDEIIIIGNIFLEDYPRVMIKITGYDRDKDKFVSYLNITTITIDEETGPEPIQYIQNQGVWGFRCLIDSLDNINSPYKPIYEIPLKYGIPLKENENFIWVFFTWDSNERKYIEKEFIEE